MVVSLKGGCQKTGTEIPSPNWLKGPATLEKLWVWLRALASVKRERALTPGLMHIHSLTSKAMHMQKHAYTCHTHTNGKGIG